MLAAQRLLDILEEFSTSDGSDEAGRLLAALLMQQFVVAMGGRSGSSGSSGESARQRLARVLLEALSRGSSGTSGSSGTGSSSSTAATTPRSTSTAPALPRTEKLTVNGNAYIEFHDRKTLMNGTLNRHM